MQVDRAYVKNHFVKAVMEPCVHPQINLLFFQLLSHSRPDPLDDGEKLPIRTKFNERVFVLIDDLDEAKVRDVTHRIKELAAKPLTDPCGVEGRKLALELLSSETLQTAAEEYVKSIYSQSLQHLTEERLQTLRTNIQKALQ